MQIPDFQSSVPLQPQNDRVVPLAPSRTVYSGVDGTAAVRSEPNSASTPFSGAVESVDSLDAVDISPLSRAIFDEPEVDSRVESLERAYGLGDYAVNPEELARTLVRTFVSDGDRRER